MVPYIVPCNISHFFRFYMQLYVFPKKYMISKKTTFTFVPTLSPDRSFCWLNQGEGIMAEADGMMVPPPPPGGDLFLSLTWEKRTLDVLGGPTKKIFKCKLLFFWVKT